MLGSIVAAVYRSMMAAALPAAVPGEAAAAARDTLGGAFAAARELPAETSAVLLSAARGAFVNAFEVTAVICAAAPTRSA
jgi:MFS transporter, DHA2 family, multidrug resistance protein